MTTILILSCGTRNKLVRFFKEAFHSLPGGGRVVVTDCSPVGTCAVRGGRILSGTADEGSRIRRQDSGNLHAGTGQCPASTV